MEGALPGSTFTQHNTTHIEPSARHLCIHETQHDLLKAALAWLIKLAVCNVCDEVQVVQLEPAMQMVHDVMRYTHTLTETSSQSATLHALVIQSKNGSVAQRLIHPGVLLKNTNLSAPLD